MRSNDAVLNVAQRTVGGRVLNRLTISDNGRPHWSLVSSPGGTNAHAACSDAGNVTYDAYLYQLQTTGAVVQARATDPQAPAGAWVTVATETCAAPAIFTTNPTGSADKLIACWYNGTSGKIRYSVSSDRAATWTAAADLVTVAANRLSGVSHASRGGLLYTVGTTAKFVGYTAAGGWGATLTSPSVWGSHTGVCGFVNGSSLVVLVGASDAANAEMVLSAVAYDFTGAAWGAAFTFRRAAGNSVGYEQMAVSQVVKAGYWYMCLIDRRETTGQDSEFWWTRTKDGFYWEDVTGLRGAPETGGGLFPVVYGGAAALYAVSNYRSYRAIPHTYSNAGNLPVVSHEWTVKANGAGMLRATVVNPSAAEITEPKGYDLVTWERGLNVAGTDYYVSPWPLWLTKFTYSKQDNLMEIEAVDGLGLLESWKADQVFNWRAATWGQVLHAIAALAGFCVNVEDGAITEATALDGEFTIMPRESALAAFARLCTKAGAEFRLSDNAGAVEIRLWQNNFDYWVHTYGGSAGQTYWPGEFGRSVSPNEVVLTGASLANGTANPDYAREADYGLRRVQMWADRSLQTLVDVQDAALKKRYAIDADSYHGKVRAVPNFALEAGDQVDFGVSLWESGVVWRVMSFTENFGVGGPGQSGRFDQVLMLRRGYV